MYIFEYQQIKQGGCKVVQLTVSKFNIFGEIEPILLTTNLETFDFANNYYK